MTKTIIGELQPEFAHYYLFAIAKLEDRIAQLINEIERSKFDAPQQAQEQLTEEVNYLRVFKRQLTNDKQFMVNAAQNPQAVREAVNASIPRPIADNQPREGYIPPPRKIRH